MKKKKHFLVFMVLFLVLSINLGVLAVEPQYGGTIRIGNNKLQSSLDPHHNMGQGGFELYVTFNTLLKYDQDLNFVPELAVSWEIPDNKTYIFNLRKGVNFHDGAEFDAEAVKWNFERMLSDYSQVSTYFNVIDQIEVMNKYKIKFRLKKPYAPFLDNLAGVGYIVSPKAVAEMGNEGFQKHPIGTGSFKFVKMNTQNGELIFEKNKNYWKKGKPYLDKMVFIEIPEEQTGVFALKTGLVDYLQQIPASNIHELQRSNGLKLISVLAKSNTIDYLTFNCNKEPFNDKKVRLAVSYALDRDKIIAFLEHCEPIPGPLPAGNWGSNPNLKKIEYNPERARELLAEAGYSDGFEVTLMIWSNDQFRSDLAVIVKEMLKKVGINVKIEVIEMTTLIQELMNNNFEFAVLHWGGGGSLDPNGNLHVLYSSKGQNNWICNYHNDKLDEYLQLALENADRQKRQGLYWKAEQILVDEQPMVWFGRFLSYLAYSTKLHGVEPLRPSGYLPNFEDLWIEH